MKELHWNTLLDVIEGKTVHPIPTGFIIDSPWLPKWYGIRILDYFSNDELWLKANLKAEMTFPDIIFLPGFWSEYGMCSEPSAYGSRCTFPANEFPHAHKVIHSVDDINRLPNPNPETDGLGPLILNRLLLNRQKIEDEGHNIYFSVSRGPLNIASYLMGTSEFLLAMMTNPTEAHRLMENITDYLVKWHDLQMQSIPTIDGILILDDIIGFIGEQEFLEFGLPYFKRIYDRDVKVKFLHNDAQCNTSIKHLPEMGVNLFNMGFDTDLSELKELTNNRVTMLGNIPPRDVLARGSDSDIDSYVKAMFDGLDNKAHIIASIGGGMPPDVSTDNIRIFREKVKQYS